MGWSWGCVWECTHVKITPSTPYPSLQNNHFRPASGVKLIDIENMYMSMGKIVMVETKNIAL